MRKLVVLTFLSLDGVMQAPGGPDEDLNGNFKYGGWTVPYFDEFLGQVMTEQMGHPFDMLLGRKTFDIFEAYWPHQADATAASINNATKYVASTTRSSSDWDKTIFIRQDLPGEVSKLKAQDGPELQVHGSGNLIQTLMKNDLVDEFWLKIFPVTLGTGKRLFENGTIPASYTLVDSRTSPNGVIVATLRRAGEVKTGSF